MIRFCSPPHREERLHSRRGCFCRSLSLRAFTTRRRSAYRRSVCSFRDGKACRASGKHPRREEDRPVNTLTQRVSNRNQHTLGISVLGQSPTAVSDLRQRPFWTLAKAKVCLRSLCCALSRLRLLDSKQTRKSTRENYVVLSGVCLPDVVLRSPGALSLKT